LSRGQRHTSCVQSSPAGATQSISIRQPPFSCDGVRSMNVRLTLCAAIAANLALLATAGAQEREQAKTPQEGNLPKLLKVLSDAHADGTDLWIYNDLRLARLQAQQENKPLFVTFRCVPCKACAGF